MSHSFSRRRFNASALLSLAAAPLAVASGRAWGAEYPERDITLVVSFGPGGVTDLMSRALARSMETSLGKSLIVTNRPGALGTLGPAYLAKQKPDGYTLGTVSASATTLTPHIMQVGFVASDLQFIAGYGISRYGLVVRSESKYQTLDDILQASKSTSMLFGSPSTPNSLLMQHLGKLAGSKFELVSYKSGVETATALMGSQVDLIVANPSDVIAHIKSGRLRLLASASSARWQEFPDVRTLKEQGYDVGYDAWVGLAVPAGTAANIVAKLQAAVQKGIEDPAVRRAYAAAGSDPAFMAGRAYSDHLERERVQMKQLIDMVGLPKVG